MTLENVQLHLVDSVDECFEFMRWLSGKTRVAFDTETTGLDVMRDQVRLVQVGDQVDGWAIPFERWSGLVFEFIRRYEGEYVMHNMSYDHMIFEQSTGITLPRNKVHDTRIMAHILRPDHSTALKKLSALYIDPRAAALQQSLDDAIGIKGEWTWATVPYDYEPYWSYGALDPVLTMQLDELFLPQIMSTCPDAYDIERAATWVCADMRKRGIRIDRPFVNDNIGKFNEYVDSVDRWCVDNYNVRPGQNASVIERLAQDGFEFDKKTASGALSLDKEVLGDIDHPLAQAVLSRRQTQKVSSTYLRNFLELADADDLLHPSINTLGFKQDDSKGGMGVRTGRMSMSEPNLQNLSRQTDRPSPANVVRRAIISRDEHTLLMCDFDQIEARLIAHLTQDAGFIGAFAEGDFFTNITRQLWSDDTIPKKDPRRQSTKNAIYGRAYGAGAPKFAVTAGIPIEAAYAIYTQLDEMYPGWKRFTKQLESVARERLNNEGVAYVRSFMTGRRHVANEDKLYVLTNYLIQGTAAEIFKMKLAQLAAAGLDRFMVVPVHDEIIMDVPNDELHDAARATLDVMNDDQLLDVPLTASIALGQRWGEKKDYDPHHIGTDLPYPLRGGER